MEENLDQALEVDVLAAGLRMDKQESGDMLESLAKRLQIILPNQILVKRELLGLGSVKEITVCFEDNHYQISRTRYGSLSAKIIKIVRSVVIKTTEVSMEQWNNEVAQNLARLAQNSAETRNALNKFING